MNNIYNYCWIYLGCDEDLGMEFLIVSNFFINVFSYFGEGYELWNVCYNCYYGKGVWCVG